MYWKYELNALKKQKFWDNINIKIIKIICKN